MAHRRAVVSLDVEKSQAYGLPGNTSQRKAVFFDDQAKGNPEELSGWDGASRTLDTFMQDKSLKEVASRVCVEKEEDALAISRRLTFVAVGAELSVRLREMQNFISPEHLSERVDEAKKEAVLREIQDAKNGRWPGVGLAIPLPFLSEYPAPSESTANDPAEASVEVDLDYLVEAIQGCDAE